MVDKTIQWFSSLATSEWLGLAGIVVTIIVAIIFSAKKTNQKSKGDNSPNINANGDVSISHTTENKGVQNGDNNTQTNHFS